MMAKPSRRSEVRAYKEEDYILLFGQLGERCYDAMLYNADCILGRWLFDIRPKELGSRLIEGVNHEKND